MQSTRLLLQQESIFIDLNVFVIALNLIAKDVPNGPKCYPQLLRDIILAIVIYSSFCL